MFSPTAISCLRGAFPPKIPHLLGAWELTTGTLSLSAIVTVDEANSNINCQSEDIPVVLS